MGKESKHAVWGVPQTSDKVCIPSSFQYTTLYYLKSPKLPLKVAGSRWPLGSSCQPTKVLVLVWVQQTCDHITWTTSAPVPARDQVAASVLSQWFRIYKGNSFYSWSVLLPAKQILIGEQCQMPMRKVCACSVTQGVWPRFSFTTKLRQHLY